MSDKEFAKDDQHVSDHVEEAESLNSGNDRREPEEAQEAGRHPVESELVYSDHDLPLEGAIGGEIECDDDIVRATLDKKLFNAGKADLFMRFFSDEYTQVDAPILERHRHNAQRQPRQRHYSDSFRTQSSSGSSPLGLFQLADPLSECILNQAGAIIGRTMPSIKPEFAQFGNENGQALSGFGRIEDPEQSIGSVETALIGDVYAGNFTPSRQSSDDSRGLSPGSTFPSFSPYPPTAALESLRASNQFPDLESSVGCRSMTADYETVEREKPARHRRLGVTKSLPVRSKSALAGCSEDYTGQSPNTGDTLQKRKISKDLSVCSEPLPERKVSKDSSVDSYERMSSEDDAVNYPELSHFESDSCLPMPDLDPRAAENIRESLNALKVSSDVASETSDVVDRNVEQVTESVQDPVAVLSGSPDVQASQQPQNT